MTALAVTLAACARREPPSPDAVARTKVQPEPIDPPAADTGEAVEDSPEAVEDLPPAERFGQNGRKLNPEVAGIGTQALEAAFPERAGGLARTALHASAAGTAGMWADSASATYGDGEKEVSIHVGDMIRVSECKRGSWHAHVDAVEAGRKTDPPQEAVAVGPHRGVYFALQTEGIGKERFLSFTPGDRCDLELTGEGLTKRELIAVATDLALDDLEAACTKRDTGSLFGP